MLLFLKTICTYRYRDVVIKSITGDITCLEINAIVNPANSYMTMGGGLAGVLKKKGGELIEKEALKHSPVPIGKAIVTPAGFLKTKHIIHSPTMENPGGPTSLDNVYKATYAALDTACRNNIYEVAIPGMGTGVGGLKPEEAVESMFRAIINYLEINNCLREIVVIDINEDIPYIFCKYLSSLKGVVRVEN